MSLILSGTDGLSDVDGSAATPAIRGTDANTGIFFPAADTIAFAEGGAECARFDSSGNFGIGTTVPVGDANRVVAVAAAGGAGFFMYDTNQGSTVTDGANIQVAGTNFYLYNKEAGFVAFGQNNTERMRIDTSGRLGIATTSPTSILTIGQGSFTAAGSNTTGMYTGSGGSGLVVLTDAFLVATRVAGTTLFSIGTGGIITSPATYSNTSAGAANMFVQTDGTFYRSTSSLKYKNNVQDATHGLADLLQLRSVTYEGKAETDAGKTFGGLIAEEVHAAGLTEFVQYAEDGSPDALAYGNMVSLCIKAIQEQQALITQLTARITALESA